MTDQGPYRFYKSSDIKGRRSRWIWIAAGVLLAIFIVWLIAPHGDQSASGQPGAAGAAGAKTGAAGAAGAGGGRGAAGGAGRGGRTGLPSTVGSARATSGDVPVYLYELGTVTPAQTVTVHTQITGQLFSVDFKEGQLVKKGQLLALVDPRPYEQALLQAEGNLIRDQAQLDEAKVDLKRYQTLLAKDSIAEQQVDTQRATVRQYEGTVKTDQAAIAAAKLNLIYCHIVSPVNGRVGLRQVDPGNLVQPGDTNGIVVVTELDPIDVLFTMPEDDIPQVSQRVHAGAILQAVALDRTEATQLAVGRLLSLDNQVDTTTGTLRAKARFANGGDALFPNQFVNIRLLVDTLHNTVIAPTAAVLRGSQGLFVWVVNQPGNTVEMRQVKTGPAVGDNTAITSGLDAGEIVVTDGSDRLREGQRVFLQGDCIPAGRGGAPAGGGRKAGGAVGAAGPGQAEAPEKTLFNLWGLIPSKPKPSANPMAAMRCRPGEHPGGTVGDASTTPAGGSSPAAGGPAAGAAGMATPAPGARRTGAAPGQAGQPSAAAATLGGTSGEAPSGAPGGHMSARMQAMFGPLNLDPAQQAKVSAIAEANQPKVMAAYQSGDMAAARAARQAMDQQIDAVLRPDQKAKMDEIRAQMRARMQGGGSGGGPQ